LRKVKLENDMFGRLSQFSDHCKDFFQDQRHEQNQGKNQATQSFFIKMTEHNYINIWSNKNRTVVTWHNKLMSWHINQSIIIVGLAMVLAATLYWG
jgi:hypothetical protein